MPRPRLLAVLLIATASRAFAAGHDVTAPTYAAAVGLDAVVASNGRTFLTLWIADRTGGGVYASVADANGNLLSPIASRALPFEARDLVQLIAAGDEFVLSFRSSSGSTIQTACPRGRSQRDVADTTTELHFHHAVQ